MVGRRHRTTRSPSTKERSMTGSTWRRLLLALSVCAAAAVVTTAASAGTVLVPASGQASPQTGPYSTGPFADFSEFATGEEAEDEDADDDVGLDVVVDRSLSHGSGPGSPAKTGKRAKSNPELNTTFEGLNIYQQRFARGGNQFTVEPPDQALCVGNGYVF